MRLDEPFTGLKQRFAGNAANWPYTGATQLSILINADYRHAELSGPNRRHIAAGTSTKDDQIEFAHDAELPGGAAFVEGIH